MNCPKCQCAEISASGTCLWCGYQVNVPADSAKKAEPAPPSETEIKTAPSMVSPAPAPPSQPVADQNRPAPSPEPKKSRSEPAPDNSARISAESGARASAEDWGLSSTRHDHVHRILFTRIFSGFVDLAVMTLSSAVLILAAHFLWGMHVRDPKSFVHWSVLFIIVYFIYSLLFIGVSSQTIGMMITNLRVIDRRSEGPPRIAAVVVRACGYLVSLFCFGIGMLWALLDPDHQCLHDRITSTHVVPIPPVDSRKQRRQSPGGAFRR